MNRFFLNDNIDSVNRITDKTDISHLRNSLRLKTGDEIEVVDGSGKESIMSIKNSSNDFVELAFVRDVSIKREPDIRITVYQGIPKGQRMDYVVQKLTEIGVVKIVPVKFMRCVKNDINSAKMQRYKSIIKEAAMQSKRSIIPVLTEPMSFIRMIDDFENNEQNVTFYEEETGHCVRDFVYSNKDVKSIGIVIGPEGGIDESEIELLRKSGIRTLTLGSRILRTETAGLVASTIFIYEYDR